MPIKIVLLSGWSNAGKDTVAQIFIDSYGYQKLAFADPVKQKVARNLNIPLSWCHNQKKKSEILESTNTTLRSELIRVGESQREKDPEVWAKKIGKQILRLQETGIEKFIVSDWRHLDELFGLQKMVDAEIYPIRVQRPSQLISPVPDHTEYGLNGFPFWRIIRNEGTIENLLGQVVCIVEEDMNPK